MTNNFSEPSDSSYTYSMHRDLRILQLGVDVLVLKELGFIDSTELINLMKMIKSPDLENYTMAETIVKDLLKKAKNGHTRET